MKGRVVN